MKSERVQLRDLKAWLERKRKADWAQWQKEKGGHENLYRPRLLGRVEAYDAVIDQISLLLNPPSAIIKTPRGREE